jgi:hypothetical protein
LLVEAKRPTGFQLQSCQFNSKDRSRHCNYSMRQTFRDRRNLNRRTSFSKPRRPCRDLGSFLIPAMLSTRYSGIRTLPSLQSCPYPLLWPYIGPPWPVRHRKLHLCAIPLRFPSSYRLDRIQTLDELLEPSFLLCLCPSWQPLRLTTSLHCGLPRQIRRLFSHLFPCLGHSRRYLHNLSLRFVLQFQLAAMEVLVVIEAGGTGRTRR